MRFKYLVSLLILLSSCILKKEKTLNLIEVDNVEKVYVFSLLETDKIEVNNKDQKLLIEDINKAKLIGKYKWIDQYRLKILLKSGEKIELFCNKNMFKVNGRGDNTYKISNNIKYFKTLFDPDPSSL
jgi:hypothetical protein